MAGDTFDFWYAVNITKVILSPRQPLETFGVTRIKYHLISELMDSVGECRVRTGMLISERPLIMTPNQLASQILEGFGEAAKQYVEWLRRHNEMVTILRYGLHIRKEDVYSEIVNGNVEEIGSRMKSLAEQDKELCAVIIGSDTHWEVSLIKFFRDYIELSAPINFRQIKQREHEANLELMREIEAEFRLAERQPDRIKKLGEKLQRLGLFEKYEDRFLDLVRRHNPA